MEECYDVNNTGGRGYLKDRLEYLELSDTEKLLNKWGLTNRRGDLTHEAQVLIWDWLGQQYHDKLVEVAQKLEDAEKK